MYVCSCGSPLPTLDALTSTRQNPVICKCCGAQLYELFSGVAYQILLVATLLLLMFPSEAIARRLGSDSVSTWILISALALVVERTFVIVRGKLKRVPPRGESN